MKKLARHEIHSQLLKAATTLREAICTHHQRESMGWDLASLVLAIVTPPCALCLSVDYPLASLEEIPGKRKDWVCDRCWTLYCLETAPVESHQERARLLCVLPECAQWSKQTTPGMRFWDRSLHCSSHSPAASTPAVVVRRPPVRGFLFAEPVQGHPTRWLVSLDCGHKKYTSEQKVMYECRECPQVE